MGRVICTHFHPDHAGLAGWLCRKFAARLWMTRGEWLTGVLAGITLARDETGTLVKGLPYRLNGAGIAIERAAPALGQHTDEVLRTLLGFDDARLRELADAGVTSTVPTVGDV